MKKLLFIVLCFTLALTFTNCGKDKKYQIVVEEINKQLPLDMGTFTMDKSEYADNEFKYYFTFKEKPEMAEEELVKANKEAMAAMVKNNPQMKIFRDDKITITMVYQLKDEDKPYAEIKVTADDYK